MKTEKRKNFSLLIFLRYQVVHLLPISLKMNLVVDVGNTLIKMAVFEKETAALLFKETAIKTNFKLLLDKVIAAYPAIERVGVSAVGDLSEAQQLRLRKIAPVFEVTSQAKLPFKNQYATPNTLGVDRIALVSAAVKTYPKINALVVDCGSCVTYDFVDMKNNYLGGAISPGLSMRYKAMHTFTKNLPLLDINAPVSFVGNSTTNAMHAGVVYGICAEIDGMIERYKQKYKDLTVILTGGDAHFLRENIKNGIFANSNFLLEGLNYLLEINSDR